jgi:hypothetical protein
MTAGRAGEPARPAQPLQVVQAVLISAEPRQELTGRPRVMRPGPRVIHQVSLLRLSGYPGAEYPKNEYFSCEDGQKPSF